MSIFKTLEYVISRLFFSSHHCWMVYAMMDYFFFLNPPAPTTDTTGTYYLINAVHSGWKIFDFLPSSQIGEYNFYFLACGGIEHLDTVWTWLSFWKIPLTAAVEAMLTPPPPPRYSPGPKWFEQSDRHFHPQGHQCCLLQRHSKKEYKRNIWFTLWLDCERGTI